VPLQSSGREPNRFTEEPRTEYEPGNWIPTAEYGKEPRLAAKNVERFGDRGLQNPRLRRDGGASRSCGGEFPSRVPCNEIERFLLGDPSGPARGVNVRQARLGHEPYPVFVSDPGQIHSDQPAELVLVPVPRIDFDQHKPAAGAVMLELDLGKTAVAVKAR